MKNLIAMLLALATGIALAQTNVTFQNFDAPSDPWGYTVSPSSYNINDDTWSIVPNLGGNVTSSHNGSSFWGMRDLNNTNGGTSGESTITFNTIDITAFNNVALSFYYITDGFDATDYIKVELFYNGISQGIESLNKDTDAWTLWRKSIPNHVTTLKLVIYAKQNGGSDYAGLDTFSIQSDVTPFCNFNYGLPATLCESFTGTIDSSDTYSATIPFTGGSSELITTTTHGIIGGDAPNNQNSGNIIITSIPEGTTATVTVKGGICDKQLAITSPINCVAPLSFPIEETFSQTTNSSLIDDPYWQNHTASGTGEVMLSTGSLSVTGLRPSLGNSVSFDGSGNDPKLSFPEITSGSIYASFIFRITDISLATNSNGGYFAVLGNFDARLWIKKEGTQFRIGISNTSTASEVQFVPTLFNTNDNIFCVLNYEVGTGTSKLWINPSYTSFNNSPPTPAIIITDSTPASKINQFMLRQDSTTETGFFIFDELRIGLNWNQVTPTTPLNTTEEEQQVFKIYPNPNYTGVLQISYPNKEKGALLIFNLNGQLIKSFNTLKTTFNIDFLPQGVYLLALKTKNTNSYRQLIIK